MKLELGFTFSFPLTPWPMDTSSGRVTPKMRALMEGILASPHKHIQVDRCSSTNNVVRACVREGLIERDGRYVWLTHKGLCLFYPHAPSKESTP